MLSDLPQTVTISGASYSAVVHDLEKNDEELQIAGVIDRYAIEVVVAQADFATLPDVGDRVTFSGREYRVKRYRDAADSVTRTLYCEDLIQ